ncbi:tetratricopeptide repeat protein [Colwelliaceae bacterium BS250]
MRLIKLLLICLSLILSACSSSTSQDKDLNVLSNDYFMDDVFIGYENIQLESEHDIYALDADMHNFISGNITSIADPYQRAHKILSNFFSQSPHSIRYENSADLIARESYHQNSANCLSLTILTYALANAAGLKVQFQEVDIPEYWVRDGDFNVLNGHVNLRVIGSKANPFKIVWGRNDLVIDFDPYTAKREFSHHIVSKDRITAMFYNNKGAKALADRDFPKAYAYLRQSIITDNQFSGAWGNLGLLYKLNNERATAEDAYNIAIDLKPTNYNTWNNLQILLSDRGDTKGAEKISKMLNKARKQNPYYHALLANEAYHSNNFLLAIKLYKKARRMQPNEHEFYFGLAKSYYKLGDIKLSEYNLKKAKKLAPFKDLENKYQSKLDLFTSL